MTVADAAATRQTFHLPDLGEGLTEAEVVRWLVAEGDTVVIDQAVAEVETAKSLVELPSPYAGVVVTLHGAEGQTLAVGAPLVTIGAAGSAGSPGATDAPRDDMAVAAPSPAQDLPTSAEAEAYREEEKAGSGNVLIGYGTAEAHHGGRRRRPRAAGRPGGRESVPVGASRVHRVVSPLVRRMARDGGVSLDDVAATGESGLITRADVARALAATTAEPWGDGERRTPLSGVGRRAAAALAQSRAEIPEATVWVDVDATALWELRESSRASGGPGLLAYVARFVVAGLQQHPVLNARFDAGRHEVVELADVHLGLAVQTERGLLVPALRRAQRQTTAGLDRAIRELTARTRAGRATTEELTSGTFTLNNYGVFGVDGSAAIIPPPQVAMLGLGRIIERPWVVAGAVVPRRIAELSFVFDHRVCDGATAAGFLRGVADAIEDPASAIARL